MSLKPPKKSDLDKSWMKARRDKPKKIQPEYHLIITEGTDTEPHTSEPSILKQSLPEHISFPQAFPMPYTTTLSSQNPN